MKKIISIFLILFSAFLIAQPPHQQSPPEKRMERMNKLTAEQQATLWSKKMTLELDLNDTQEQQVYALVLSKANTHKKRRFGFFYSNFSFFANLLCIQSIPKPKAIEVKIRMLFKTPSTEKDIRIRMVEIIKPEFLITL